MPDNNDDVNIPVDLPAVIALRLNTKDTEALTYLIRRAHRAFVASGLAGMPVEPGQILRTALYELYAKAKAADHDEDEPAAPEKRPKTRKK